MLKFPIITEVVQIIADRLLPPVVMISGFFDPVQDGHLSYLKQAIISANALICVIGSDKQLLMKKGKVNIPEDGRREIIDLLLHGLKIRHLTIINIWDTETTLVAKALRAQKPDIFFRGGDKTLESMPSEERKVCDELKIKILHATLEKARHGKNMQL